MKLNNIALNDTYINHKNLTSGQIYGASVATNDFLRAIIKHTTAETITYNCVKGLYQESAIKRLFRHASSDRSSNVSLNLINRLDLINERVKIDADIWHDIGPGFINTMFSRELYSKNRPPITYTVHCASTPHIMYDFFLMKLHMPFQMYDSLICTSKSLRDVMEYQISYITENFNRIYNTNIIHNGRFDIIPLGVDVDFFCKKDKIIARKKYNIPTDSFVIEWLGRFSAFDKADLFPLINVFEKIIKKNSNKNIVLVLIGHDVESLNILPSIKEYIKKLNIENKVYIISEHKLHERNDLLSIADVFTSPIDNVQETFGLTPIEAMACGVPQIVSDWNGYKDTVIHEVTGFRIPTYWCKCTNDISKNPFNVSYEYECEIFHNHFLIGQSVVVDLEIYQYYLQLLIDNPTLLKTFSDNSIKISREKFSWNEIIKKYEQLWLSLIDISKTNTAILNMDKLNLFTFNIHEAFNSYPTKFIDFEDEIFISNDGIKFINSNDEFNIHYKFDKELLDLSFIRNVLLYIYNENSTIKISNLVKKFNNNTYNIILRSIMYLLKHGLLIINKS